MNFNRSRLSAFSIIHDLWKRYPLWYFLFVCTFRWLVGNIPLFFNALNDLKWMKLRKTNSVSNFLFEILFVKVPCLFCFSQRVQFLWYVLFEDGMILHIYPFEGRSTVLWYVTVADRLWCSCHRGIAEAVGPVFTANVSWWLGLWAGLKITNRWFSRPDWPRNYLIYNASFVLEKEVKVEAFT